MSSSCWSWASPGGASSRACTSATSRPCRMRRTRCSPIPYRDFAARIPISPVAMCLMASADSCVLPGMAAHLSQVSLPSRWVTLWVSLLCCVWVYGCPRYVAYVGVPMGVLLCCVWVSPLYCVCGCFFGCPYGCPYGYVVACMCAPTLSCI